MFLDIVDSVKRNVEVSINRLGLDGVKILNLVIPKPDIPQDIVANYNAVKVQCTEQLMATQQQQKKSKKETESIKAILDAKHEKAVLKVEIQKHLEGLSPLFCRFQAERPTLGRFILQTVNSLCYWVCWNALSPSLRLQVPPPNADFWPERAKVKWRGRPIYRHSTTTT